MILAASGKYRSFAGESLSGIALQTSGTISDATEISMGRIISSAGSSFSTALSGNKTFFVNSGYIDFENFIFDSASKPWTAQLWFYPTASASRRVFLVHAQAPRPGADEFAAARIELASGTTGNFRYNALFSSGSGWADINVSNATNRPLNQWHHLAVVYNGSRMLVYSNGAFVLQSSVMNATYRSGRHIVGIGAAGTGYAGANRFTGHVQDIRYVDGQILYTGTFTPPTRST